MTLSPLWVSAGSAVDNAGFLPENIWYSKDPFFSGDKIRIYTVVFNGSPYDIMGNVEFYDNGLAVGKAPFSLSNTGRVQDLWVDWTAGEGNHVITARIIDSTARNAGGTRYTAVLENTETGKSTRVIDIDTDGDGVGNTVDADDDNDGVPDTEELKNGTNPLKKDTDGNGVSDAKELELRALETKKDALKAASSTGVLGAALDTLKTVDDSIPEPVKAGATTGVNSLEGFRVSEGYGFQLQKEAHVKELASVKAREAEFEKNPNKKELQSATDTMLGTAEKPFTYLLIAIYALLQYLFQWQVLFYGLALYILYRLVSWGVRLVRNRY